MNPWTVRSVEAAPLDCPMSAPFTISGGESARVRNVLVRVLLADGTRGYGEGAPFPAYNGETQRSTLAAARRAGRALVGRDLRALRPALEAVDERLSGGAARAALGLALADAWARKNRMPLRLLFGGAETRLLTDVTVTIVAPAEAEEAARRLRRMGIGTIKIKVGREPIDDEARVRAVVRGHPKARLILDANQGYSPRRAIGLLASLRARTIRPALFEQPVRKDDLAGMAAVRRHGRVAVAADESAASRADVLRLARRGAADVVNIKLMKAGLLEAWDIALCARAAGLGLMIGGNVESSLAMAGAAHFAAGLGGFSFIDLDTPLWFAKDPMRGVKLQARGLYDLAPVRRGIGVEPACDPFA